MDLNNYSQCSLLRQPFPIYQSSRNPIESTFATIRLRHRKTKNNGSAKASLVMIFKLAQSASKGWRKLRGHQHIPELIKGVRFIDGVIEQSTDELKPTTTKSPTTHTEIVA